MAKPAASKPEGSQLAVRYPMRADFPMLRGQYLRLGKVRENIGITIGKANFEIREISNISLPSNWKVTWRHLPPHLCRCVCFNSHLFLHCFYLYFFSKQNIDSTCDVFGFLFSFMRSCDCGLAEWNVHYWQREDRILYPGFKLILHPSTPLNADNDPD